MSEKHSPSAAQPLYLSGNPALSRPPRRSLLWYPLPVLIGALIGCLYGSQTTSAFLPHHARPSSCGRAPGPSDPEYIWETIVPSKKLLWAPCYGDKLCAKFAVPLDYSDLSGPEAAIALIKVPAKISAGQEGYRGPVLINPGGPGGSGVETVRDRGPMLQKILGDEFDIVGFDPRGVGRTQPRILIFQDKVESAAWQLLEAPPINSTPDALARRHAQAIIYGSLAEQRVPEAAQYVSTALVSRDMLAITRAHGYERLQYWGFSYGTILGATFAAMFPDNVERLIIDGVVDAEDYYKTLWSKNLRDTDKTLRWFTDACAEVGPSECAFYESSPNKVAARVDSLFEKLKTRPIAVPLPRNSTGNGVPSYGVVDYALVRGLVFSFLYNPFNNGIVSAGALGRILAAADKGDGLPAWSANKDTQPLLKCECPGAPAPPSKWDAHLTIACSDGDPVEDSLDDLQELYEKIAKDSSFANLWDTRAACSGWKIRPKERFNGPFVGNTSFPLLIIGNTADPVTPLWNAHKASKGFQNSVVLTQNSPGHCSTSATSLCTMKHVRDYFREGKVPKPNITCETEDKLFKHAVKAQDELLGDADRELLGVVRELSAAFEIPHLHM